VSRTGFVSDWNGSHPFVAEYLGDPRQYAECADATYQYFDHHRDLIEAIQGFHVEREGLAMPQVVPGDGATSFLAAWALWLLESGVREIFYVPPLYYTLHHLLRIVGIRTRPVAGRQVFEPEFVMHLPDRKCVLLFTDPVWFAARCVPEDVIEELLAWQVRTSSLIFVDGSFQFTRWDGVRCERTSRLLPDLTVRLVCPTKSLGIHQFRFAYLLVPPHCRDDFLFLYESVVGATAYANVLFAKRAMSVLRSPEANTKLFAYCEQVLHRLVAQGLFATTIAPETGYFVFGKLAESLRGVAMGQEFFEQRHYPEYVRVNLLKVASDI